MVLVWTLTLKRKNSTKIGSPLRHLSQVHIFFRWNIGTDHDIAVYFIINEEVDGMLLVESFVHWIITAAEIHGGTRMPHVGLSEHDDNLNSVSSQCARGKSSIARKPEIHQKKNKKNKKNNGVLFLQKSNHLDFKFYLGKLNNKIFFSYGAMLCLCLFSLH